MKLYTTQTWYELLKEGHGYTPKDDHLKARKRANTSDAAQSGKKPKMSGDFSDTPRKGEVRSVETGLTLPKGKGKGNKKVEEVKSSKAHGKDVEEKEFDKGVYGFQSDLTGTIKGHDAKKLRSKRLSKTRMHRWSKAIKKLTGSSSVEEAKRSPNDQEGDRGDPKGDKALDTFYDLERLKFLKRSGRRRKK